MLSIACFDYLDHELFREWQSAQWIADGKPDPRNASGNLTVFFFYTEIAS